MDRFSATFAIGCMIVAPLGCGDDDTAPVFCPAPDRSPECPELVDDCCYERDGADGLGLCPALRLRCLAPLEACNNAVVFLTGDDFEVEWRDGTWGMMVSNPNVLSEGCWAPDLPWNEGFFFPACDQTTPLDFCEDE